MLGVIFMYAYFIIIGRITEKEILKIKEILCDYASHWKEIGQYLGFTHAKLNGIETKPGLFMGAPISFLNDMLGIWQRWDGKGTTTIPTRESIVVAVSKAGLGVIAENIRDMKV